MQQDPEVGEAWANMGAIYMRRQSFSAARGMLVEAQKHKRDSWQVAENLVSCCMALGRCVWVGVYECVCKRFCFFCVCMYVTCLFSLIGI